MTYEELLKLPKHSPIYFGDFIAFVVVGSKQETELFESLSKKDLVQTFVVDKYSWSNFGFDKKATTERSFISEKTNKFFLIRVLE